MTLQAARWPLADLPVNVWLVGQSYPTLQRRDWYVPESFRHPGKMLPELARRLVLHLTEPGAWILDPMSGVGTTGVEAIRLERNYVGVELEPRFVRVQQANLALANEKGAPGHGSAFEGDARRLAASAEDEALSALSPTPFNAVITSPPYGQRVTVRRSSFSRRMRELIASGRIRGTVAGDAYSDRSENIGNIGGEAHLESMRRVYAGCLSMLRPGGVMAVVLRPCRDDRGRRPLHHETAALCLDLGFELEDEIVAVIGRVDIAGPEPVVRSRSSFFHRLAVAHRRQRGLPSTLEVMEWVLVFRKPDKPHRLQAGPPALPPIGGSPAAVPANTKSGRQTALGWPFPEPLAV